MIIQQYNFMFLCFDSNCLIFFSLTAGGRKIALLYHSKFPPFLQNDFCLLVIMQVLYTLTAILFLYYILMLRNNKGKKQFDICIYVHYFLLPLFPLESIQYSVLCLSALPIIKVSPGPFQANRYSLRHGPGLCSL